MRKSSIIDLVAEQCEEDVVPRSLVEALGTASVHLRRFEQELARAPDEQDAERLLQELVGLAAVAVSAGAAHVLPALRDAGERRRR